MRHALLAALVLGACARGAGLRPAAAVAPAAPAAFPLRPGLTWTYQGTEEVFDESAPEGGDAHPLTVTATVREVVVHGDATGALVTGLPSLGLGIADSVVVVTGAKVWVLAADEQSLARLRDPTAALVPAEPAAIELPLAIGAARCDSPEAPAPMYCVVVEEPDDGGPDLTKVAGVPAGARQVMYIYRTNPDDTEMYFAPGVGVTGYRYHHHGTTDSRDLLLVKIEPALP